MDPRKKEQLAAEGWVETTVQEFLSGDTAEQLELFQSLVKVEYQGQTIGERFEEFHQANPHVYREIVRRSLRLRRRGVKRFGMKAIFEVMRYDYALQTQGDEYKLNNNYTAHYARLVMAEVPELEGLFELREQVSKK